MSFSSTVLTKIIRATSLVSPSLTFGCGPACLKRVYLDEVVKTSGRNHKKKIVPGLTRFKVVSEELKVVVVEPGRVMLSLWAQ